MQMLLHQSLPARQVLFGRRPKGFNPHPKNPNLRKFFMTLGWAEEIGSGIRNTRKYLPRYVENATPIFIDETMFRTVIPLVRYTMSDFTDEWFKWLELEEKWRPKLTESLKNIEIDGQLHKMSWEDRISFLSLSWIENITKFVPSSSKYRTKLKEKNIVDNQKNNNNQVLSSNENGTKLLQSQTAKVTKLTDKRLQYIITILLVSGIPVSRDELTDIFSYQNLAYFRQIYLKPLESVGFIKKNNPEKPTASNQKYLITEKGKRFLTGKDD